MGIVSSKPEEGPALYLRDQNRLSISSLVVTNPRKRTSVNVVPNAFPATRVSVQKPLSDTSPIEFVQASCAGLRPLFEASTDPSAGSRYFESNGTAEFPREAQQ
ncbi:hypothetical protein ACHAPM_009406 [Fusarium culmorum]